MKENSELLAQQKPTIELVTPRIGRNGEPSVVCPPNCMPNCPPVCPPEVRIPEPLLCPPFGGFPRPPFPPQPPRPN